LRHGAGDTGTYMHTHTCTYAHMHTRRLSAWQLSATRAGAAGIFRDVRMQVWTHRPQGVGRFSGSTSDLRSTKLGGSFVHCLLHHNLTRVIQLSLFKDTKAHVKSFPSGNMQDPM
jgi:hypothetical protein